MAHLIKFCLSIIIVTIIVIVIIDQNDSIDVTS